MSTPANDLRQKYGRRLGKILFSRVLLFSLVLTLLFTLIQAALDFRSRINDVRATMNDIDDVHAKGIIAALWNFDRHVLKEQIEGMRHRRYINYIGVIENGQVLIDNGTRKQQDVISQEIPLSYEHLGKEVSLGVLAVQADRSLIQADVVNRIAGIFLFSLMLVSISVLFLFWLFDRMVTRHLYSLAAYFREIAAAPDHISAPLQLDKKLRNDELDTLARTVNDMQTNLASSYDEIRRSRDRFSALYNETPVMMHSIDSTGRIVEVNNHWLKVLGYERNEVIGRKSTDFLTEASRTYAREAVLPAFFRDGFLKNIEYQFVTKNGAVVDAILSATSERDAAGNIILSRSVIEDVSERKRADDQRVKLENQLRQAQKMEAVGQLAGGVAHDFNNILSAIVGYSHLALMKMGVEDPNRLNIEQILNSSDRAVVLTQSLLAFSRKQVVNLARMDLNETIAKFEKFMLRLLREDIELKTIVPAAELPVIADRGQIEQVLMNLVTNARDAMPRGGRLTIETGIVNSSEFDDENPKEAELRSELQAQGSQPTDFAFISVSDTGMGMTDEVKRKVFEPFFTTKEEGKGTGLGLSMVYGIVKQHQGVVTVSSTPGLGTTFRIYLPAVHVATNAGKLDAPSAPVTTSVKGGTETILLAEDDAVLRKMTTTVLREFGYTVLEAEDGQQAVGRFAENKAAIQLIILDGIMPVMNGKDAFRKITELAPGMRCIIMSGYAEDVFTKDGVLQETVDFISKPVTPSVLLTKIREVIDRKAG